MKTTERILFKKGRRIICYIDIMPEKIKVKNGKPSDSCCISWEYQPNELEKAKATATEFFDNVTRIWTLTTHEERTQGKHFAPFLFACSPQGKKKTQRQSKKGKTMQEDKQRQPEQSRTKRERQNKKASQKDKIEGKRRKIGANTPQAFYPPNRSRT